MPSKFLTEKDDGYPSRVADEILTYLTKFPNAGDSIRGIATCWLSSPHTFPHQREKVQMALDHLHQRGLVTQTEIVDGTVLYRASFRLLQPSTLQ